MDAIRLLPLLIPLFAGCAGDRLLRVKAANFRSASIQRCLWYWTSNFSSHPTNHFYVGATGVSRGELDEAIVYWKEERMLLFYSELAEDATPGMEIMAWGPHNLKLDKDTVDTQDEVGGSNYLVTHRVWIDWMEQCISKGKQYVVTLDEARRLSPKRKVPGSI